MKRKILYILTTLSISIIMIFTLSSCIYASKSVVSIAKTDTIGLRDIYTITYSDGTTSSFEITNGKDGEDANDITVDMLYEKYLELYPDASYKDFVNDILDGTPQNNIDAINKSLLSSAIIYAEFTEPTSESFFNTTYDTTFHIGSSIIYKIDEEYTYFITNYHIVYEQSSLESNKLSKKLTCYLYGSLGGPSKTENTDKSGCTIYDYGNYGISCELVGGSIAYDIAIIKAKTSDVLNINENAKAVKLANGYEVGETAIAIGNPEGEGISVTQGIISVDSETIQLSFDNTVRNFRSIRVDTAIYHGSSGGGLFNSNGELIGITNAGDEQDQNVNYAIPLEIVKGVTENILFYSTKGNLSPKKITIGITVYTKNSKFVYDEKTGKGKIVETLEVTQVNEDSIAKKMNINLNDVIKSFVINGVEHSIYRNFNIGDLILTLRVGDEISFIVSRNNETIETTKYTIQESDLIKVE